VSNDPPPLDGGERVSRFAGAGLGDRDSTVRERGAGAETGAEVPVPDDSDCDVVVVLSDDSPVNARAGADALSGLPAEIARGLGCAWR